MALAILSGSPLLPAQSQRGCVTVHATARPTGIGYTHIASTENGCSRGVVCELWSNVDPEPRHVVALEPAAAAETVFRRDSPAYEFRAYYRCSYR